MLIEVKEIPPPADWYTPTSYPGDGVYLHSNSLFLVSGGMVNSCSGIIPPAAVRSEQAGGAITEGLLLRSIAVAQRPELAKDLT